MHALRHIETFFGLPFLLSLDLAAARMQSTLELCPARLRVVKPEHFPRLDSLPDFYLLLVIIVGVGFLPCVKIAHQTLIHVVRIDGLGAVWVFLLF